MTPTPTPPAMVESAYPDHRPATDCQLLIAWRHGDREAGDRLLRRHWSAIHAFFRNRVSGDHDELAQRTFVACAEGCSRIRKAKSFRAYLFGVANNVLREHLRWSRVAASRKSEPTTDDAPLAEYAHRASVTTLIDSARECGVLLRALRLLSPADQLVLQLSYWEQRSSSEIARLCGMPAVTVRGRLFRARRELSRHIERLGEQAGPWASPQELETWAHDGLAHRRGSMAAAGTTSPLPMT